MKSYTNSTTPHLIRNFSLTLALAVLLPSCATTSGGASGKPGGEKNTAVATAGAEVCQLIGGITTINRSVTASKFTNASTASEHTVDTYRYTVCKVDSRGLLSFREERVTQRKYYSGASKNKLATDNLPSYHEIPVSRMEIGIYPIQIAGKSMNYGQLASQQATEYLTSSFSVTLSDREGRKTVKNKLLWDVGDSATGKSMNDNSSYGSLACQTKQQAEALKAALESLQSALR